jgi:hypothetical protein
MLAEIREQLGVVSDLLLEPGAIVVSDGHLGRRLRVTHSAKSTRQANAATSASAGRAEVPEEPGRTA